ncbi:MAG: hypothetical protein AAGE43_03700 [Pseudomonadota bacterium]
MSGTDQARTSGSPLESSLARLFGTLGNATLDLDPASKPRLSALAGRSARFEIVPPWPEQPTRPLTVLVTAAGLELSASRDQEPHVIVTGTLPAILLSFARPEDPAGLRIDGDEATLAAIADLLRNLEPDLSRPLGNVLGESFANDLIGAAEAGIAFLKSAAESVAGEVQAQAEQAYVAETEFAGLMERRDALRLRLDRLAARTGLLENQD